MSNSQVILEANCYETKEEENGMKKLKFVAIMLVVATFLCGCGATYECSRCKDKVSEAYYDPFNDGKYFCEDCARDYFAPFPYKNYKVD